MADTGGNQTTDKPEVDCIVTLLSEIQFDVFTRLLTFSSPLMFWI